MPANSPCGSGLERGVHGVEYALVELVFRPRRRGRAGGTPRRRAETALCRMAGGLDRVRDHEDGLPLAVDLAEEVEQRVRGAGIERAGRLVGQQKLRGSDQSPRHRRALLFAAGDLVRVLGQQFVDASLRASGLMSSDMSSADMRLSTSGR